MKTQEIIKSIDGQCRLRQVETIFSEVDAEFPSNVCDCWPQIEEVGDLDISNVGVKMSYKLRKLSPTTMGVLQRLICALMLLSPHSMTVEKVISHYNQMKSTHRMSTSEETINARMFRALNGMGTAHYELRPAVAEFILNKERHYREPDLSLYTNRELVMKGSEFVNPSPLLNKVH